MSVIRAFNVAFETMKKRNWDKIYVFFDIHSTILKPNYESNNIPKEFYPFAKETLQLISKRKDVCMGIYTCSHPHEIEAYVDFFKENKIHFEMINENPEVKTDNGGYGNYDKKPYFNVLFEDKCGFDANEEWEEVYNFLNGQKNK